MEEAMLGVPLMDRIRIEEICRRSKMTDIACRISRVFGLELRSSKPTRKCRSSIIVCVCWTSVVACGIGALIFFLSSPQGFLIDIGINETWYLRRNHWQALPSYEIEYLELPVKYVIFAHSSNDYCAERFPCIDIVRDIQQNDLRRGYQDIGPNFLVGGNGFVFEGRGANAVARKDDASSFWDTTSVYIMFIGDYNNDRMDDWQMTRVHILLDILVKEGVLTENYEILGYCQIIKTDSPGNNIMARISEFMHWNSHSDIRSGTESLIAEVSCWEYLRTVARNSSRAERVACGVALCSLLVSIIMIICFVVVTKHVGNPSEPDNAPWNISREQWRSKHVDPDICNTTKRFNPIRLVIINHSEGNECHNFINCAAEMRNLQRYFQSREGYIDLPYNFVIGNDGRVYEGRGWGLAGAHSGRLNACSLGIGFLEVPFQKYIANVVKNSTRVERLACVAATLALLVAIILIVYFTTVTNRLPDPPLDDAPWNITREMWLSQWYDYDTHFLTDQYDPLRLVVISHTVSNECHNFLNCASEIRTMQIYYLTQIGWDLPFNFMIGNDGRVYEARGWGIAGAHTPGYNNCTFGIGFIGDYRVEGMNTQVTELQVARTFALLDYGIRHGHLDPDYVVVGQKDLRATESPGANLYAVINQWTHYDKERYNGMSCQEIYAD